MAKISVAAIGVSEDIKQKDINGGGKQTSREVNGQVAK